MCCCVYIECQLWFVMEWMNRQQQQQQLNFVMGYWSHQTRTNRKVELERQQQQQTEWPFFYLHSLITSLNSYNRN